MSKWQYRQYVHHFPALVRRRRRDWDGGREEHAGLCADHGPVLKRDDVAKGDFGIVLLLPEQILGNGLLS